MGIRFWCPNGHKLNVKAFQAGRRGICPYCGARFVIPAESTRRTGAGDRIPEPQEHSVHEGGVTSMPPEAVQYQPGDAAQPESAPQPQAAPMPEAGAAPMDMQAAPSQVPLTPVEGAAPGAPQAAPSADFAAGPQPAYTAMPLSPSSPAAPSAAPAAAAANDPLAEAPDAVWYVRPPTGGQFGPATADVMRNWIEEGRVSPDSLVWREGWRDWQEAGAVLPQLGADDASALAFGGSSPQASAPARIARASRPNAPAALVIVILVLAVLILFGVFLWVAFAPGPSGSNESSSARTVPPSLAFERPPAA